MAIRNIVKVGDEILTKKCRPVTEYGPRLWLLLDDMRDTLGKGSRTARRVVSASRGNTAWSSAP